MISEQRAIELATALLTDAGVDCGPVIEVYHCRRPEKRNFVGRVQAPAASCYLIKFTHNGPSSGTIGVQVDDISGECGVLSLPRNAINPTR